MTADRTSGLIAARQLASAAVREDRTAIAARASGVSSIVGLFVVGPAD